MNTTEKNIFNITFNFDDKPYKGWVDPSATLNDSGTPVSFHVVLNEASFGYLSFKDCRWMVNEERPAGLVKLIGKQIEKHYQF